MVTSVTIITFIAVISNTSIPQYVLHIHSGCPICHCQSVTITAIAPSSIRTSSILSYSCVLPILQVFTDLTPLQFAEARYRVIEDLGPAAVDSDSRKQPVLGGGPWVDRVTSSAETLETQNLSAEFDESTASETALDILPKSLGPSPDVTPPPNHEVSYSASTNTAWRTFRFTGYYKLVESLLGRGGCNTGFDAAMGLLREMIVKEHMTLHQGQVRGLLHCAIQHDHGPLIPTGAGAGDHQDKSPSSSPPLTAGASELFSSQPVSVSAHGSSPLPVSPHEKEYVSSTNDHSTYGNGVRLFLELRKINPLKPDEVMFKMVIKSIVRRRRRIQSAVKHPGQWSEPDDDLSSLTILLQAMKEDGIKASPLTNREVLYSDIALHGLFWCGVLNCVMFC